MKYLKRFDESKTIHNLENYIECIEGDYNINNDGNIDVDGGVNFNSYHLSEIPFSFGNINYFFDCSHNELINLKNSPIVVNGYFDCSYNKLTSFEYFPKYIYGNLYCNDNELYDFYGIGELDNIRSIHCEENPVYEIFKLCPTIEFIKYLNEFRPIRGKDILGKRLEECLYMCNIELDVTKLQFKNYTLLE